MKDIRHFIWDFDGTLFDTYGVIIRSLRSALGEFGRDCDPTDCMARMLVSIVTARDHYADLYGIGREALAGAYKRYHYASLEALEAGPMEGAGQVLEAIREKGCHSYIFSHRKRREIMLYLERHGLEDCFRDIIGPDTEGFAQKPAPDAVLHLMAKYGMTAGDTVMLGDRDCDLGSARNAGIRTAHLVCPAVPQELACDWRLEKLSDLLDLLREGSL